MTDNTIPKGVAKLNEEKAQPHVVLRRTKYRSRLPGERYIDPGTGEVVTFEHIEDWRQYKDLRDGRHIRLATPEEIKAAETAVKPEKIEIVPPPGEESDDGKPGKKGGKS
jgi:hypothetical protein